MKDPRYDGKPLLRLIELWVLWVIDEIDEDDISRLQAMEPKLRETWHLTGTWHEMIESVLKLEPAIRDELRRVWLHNVETAKQLGFPSPKQEFVHAIADQLAGIAPESPELP